VRTYCSVKQVLTAAEGSNLGLIFRPLGTALWNIPTPRPSATRMNVLYLSASTLADPVRQRRGGKKGHARNPNENYDLPSAAAAAGLMVAHYSGTGRGLLLVIRTLVPENSCYFYPVACFQATTSTRTQVEARVFR
jgi:hypothetical protein